MLHDIEKVGVSDNPREHALIVAYIIPSKLFFLMHRVISQQLGVHMAYQKE